MAPWVNIGVVPNGEYTLCCVSQIMNMKEERKQILLSDSREFHEIDKEDKLYLGSLHDNTLEEIWNNDKMRDIRSRC